MAEISVFQPRLLDSWDADSALVAGGILVLVGVFLAIVAHYMEESKPLSLDQFFLTPYLKFAYASFLKPHTGKSDSGQQNALESFYSAQVSLLTPNRSRARSAKPGYCL